MAMKMTVGIWASSEPDGWMTRLAMLDLDITEELPDPVTTDDAMLQAFWADKIHRAIAAEFDLPCAAESLVAVPPGGDCQGLKGHENCTDYRGTGSIGSAPDSDQ